MWLVFSLRTGRSWRSWSGRWSRTPTYAALDMLTYSTKSSYVTWEYNKSLSIKPLSDHSRINAPTFRRLDKPYQKFRKDDLPDSKVKVIAYRYSFPFSPACLVIVEISTWNSRSYHINIGVKANKTKNVLRNSLTCLKSDMPLEHGGSGGSPFVLHPERHGAQDTVGQLCYLEVDKKILRFDLKFSRPILLD